jgi:hypothetical protein
MAKYHAAVESRRSAHDTFDYLATFSNAAEWDPGVLAAGNLTRTRSGPGRGSGSWCPSSAAGSR